MTEWGLLILYYSFLGKRLYVSNYLAVEDPSENFQRLRDFVDVRNCMLLNNFQPDYLLEGFHDAMAEEACKKLKLNRVWNFFSGHFMGVAFLPQPASWCGRSGPVLLACLCVCSTVGDFLERCCPFFTMLLQKRDCHMPSCLH